MTDPVSEYSDIWLTSSHRDYWWGRLFGPLLISSGGIFMWVMRSLTPLEPVAFFVIMAIWIGCFIVAAQALAKWISEPVGMLLNSDSLTACLTESNTVEKLTFNEIQDYQYSTNKEGSSLYFILQNDVEVRWTARYKVRNFQKMVAEFEYRFKMFQWQQRPYQPPPRR